MIRVNGWNTSNIMNVSEKNISRNKEAPETRIQGMSIGCVSVGERKGERVAAPPPPSSIIFCRSVYTYKGRADCT
jgi:hypothetical protein